MVPGLAGSTYLLVSETALTRSVQGLGDGVTRPEGWLITLVVAAVAARGSFLKGQDLPACNSSIQEGR
jgi:hypothetical protein